MKDTLKRHWPEYLMEAAGLGLFMISAALFATLLEHPQSSIHQALPDPLVRRVFMGLGMGLTAIGIIYSPWGQQSGAHLNPSITLTFFRLGKIAGCDAAFYVVAQCVGGITGILVATVFLTPYIADPEVNFVVTVPGVWGTSLAFMAELTISAILMIVVLFSTNSLHLFRYTGVLAGALVAVYITVEAPFSGMSMNLARSLASAVPARQWTGFWVYLSAPLLGMLLGAELYLLRKGRDHIRCAKLNHYNSKRCIFRCGYHKP